MLKRFSRGLFLSWGFLVLIASAASATTITAASGTCVEFLDPWERDNRECVRWVGGGFTVTPDSPSPYHPDVPSDSFEDDFGLDSDHFKTELLFTSFRPFTLTGLDVSLGAFDDGFSDGCATPMDVSSSRGGGQRIYPLPAPPGQQCWIIQAQQPVPYPWRSSHLFVTFAGAEWQDLDWFHVVYAAFEQPPFPRYSAFTLNAVQFVPEPGTLLLFVAGAVTVRIRLRR
jgi:hypothetical protein